MTGVFGQSSTVAADEDVLHLGLTFWITGGKYGYPNFVQIKDLFEEVNAKGGINGRKARGGAGAGNGGEVFGAGPQAVLLCAAVNERRERRPPIAIQHADALGPSEPVRGKGEQGNVVSVDIDGQPAAAGSGIDKEWNGSLGGECAQGGEVLHGAEVVVGLVSGDEDGLGRVCLGDGVGGHASLAINGHT